MTDIAGNVAAVRAEIAAACVRAGRDPAAVQLVAVTKTQGPGVLAALRSCGIRAFGENRVEHLDEMRAADPGDAEWHYLGRVQGRQLARIAPQAAVLHSLCESDHVARLERACAAAGRRMGVYLQVNASGEEAKAGLAPDALGPVLDLARAQPHLDVLGLMTMAPELGVHAEADVVRACFARLRTLARQHGLSGLSMGMSGDLGIAVEEGATVVRVGSRLFA